MEKHHYAVAESGYRRRSFLIACIAAASWLNCGAAAWAHHSFAMYDLQKVLDVKGTVKKFAFTNPHSSIVLLVKDRAGKSSDYVIETNGSFYLAKNQGWKRDSLKPGDKVVAHVRPLRDGTPGGDLIKVTLSDGRELIARTQASLAPPADKK